MPNKKQLFSLILITLLALSAGASAELKQQESVAPFIGWLLEDGERLEDVPFAEVVEAVSGKKVLPLEMNDSKDAEMAMAIRRSVRVLLRAFESPDHPIHQVGRINEVSGHVEALLLAELNRSENLLCEIPTNASGELQRSGYPDLRLLHKASDRVVYIDPKVYKKGSETSSFRTFYFEPKKETNKILDDASHLILGISHGGKVDGRWQFEGWKLVDLSKFRVRLKAEFQASNRDLYREESVKLESN